MKKSLLLLVVCCVLLPLLGVGQIITTVIGNGTGTGEGIPATSASVYDPFGVVFDSQYNLYFDEHLKHRIRKIDRNGIVRTIAGFSGHGYNGDNIPATAAKLDQPSGLAFDAAGNLFIADLANCRIRKIDMTTGLITTICGNGSPTSTGDNGPATAATTKYPQGLCIDKHGNIFFAEINRLRKINVFGTISTVAGDGSLAETGDGGPATAAKTGSAWVDVDDSDNVYVAGMYVVRKINAAGIISTIAGDTSSAYYNGDEIPATDARLEPVVVKFDNRKRILYVSDAYNDRVRIIGSDGIIHTFAGTGVGGASGDGGRPDTAKTNHPTGIAFDSCDNVYFGQVDNPRIRKVTFDTCYSLPSTTIPYNVYPSSEKLSVYPNPINNELHIQATEPIANISITNLLGQVIVQSEYITPERHLTIPTRDLPKGMYLVKINGLFVQRVVKE